MRVGKHDHDKQRPGKKIVNVRFDKEDFKLVQEAAVTMGMGVETFIRHAARSEGRRAVARLRIERERQQLEERKLQLESEALRLVEEKVAGASEIQVELRAPVEDG